MKKLILYVCGGAVLGIATGLAHRHLVKTGKARPVAEYVNTKALFAKVRASIDRAIVYVKYQFELIRMKIAGPEGISVKEL